MEQINPDKKERESSNIDNGSWYLYSEEEKSPFLKQ